MARRDRGMTRHAGRRVNPLNVSHGIAQFSVRPIIGLSLGHDSPVVLPRHHDTEIFIKIQFTMNLYQSA
jgi:hypothetical protein